jgi:hypothetical protein
VHLLEPLDVLLVSGLELGVGSARLGLEPLCLVIGLEGVSCCLGLSVLDQDEFKFLYATGILRTSSVNDRGQLRLENGLKTQRF